MVGFQTCFIFDQIAYDIRSCFVSEVRCLEDTEVYDLFGIDDSKDAIVLVRPDGYISTILDMGENGAQQVFEFLSKL